MERDCLFRVSRPTPSSPANKEPFCFHFWKDVSKFCNASVLESPFWGPVWHVQVLAFSDLDSNLLFSLGVSNSALHFYGQLPLTKPTCQGG
jgi:hypothetical protein